jgi:hypothetical protein
MRIANPIYDVVFKYLMEDVEIAKGLLSAIINTEIVSLEIKPQEISTTINNGSIRILRIDFKATIKTQNGKLRVVLIELQKTKKGDKMPRFRDYLGLNYKKLEDVSLEDGTVEKVNLPITTIYFLGFRLKNIMTPALYVKREYYNLITNRKIKTTNDFVENLSHDMYAIQIPRLNMVARTELEQLLDVFSQTKYQTSDKHILEYTGNSTNDTVKKIVNRLNTALLDEELLRAVQAEEEVEDALNEKNVEIEKLNKKLKEAQEAKEKFNQKLKEELKAKEEERKAKEEALEYIKKLEEQITLMNKR